ncbi:hypothetical protein PENSPDRAFT_641761 [Peniophora sp. CONT]|nr:hypothetical protein PENSPDRAFT_641761 [Peniophora sp. CONT]
MSSQVIGRLDDPSRYPPLTFPCLVSMLLSLPSGQIVVDSVEDAVSHLIPTVSRERALGARLHALIIGISTYERYPLRGAASDANAVHEYLRSKLDVPEHQIKKLRNEEATRAAIIQELTALSTRESINEGDPILIYFAGYGSSASEPQGWQTGWHHGRVDLLVPYDSLLSDKRKCVPPIPDRTIAALLQVIEEKKSDNTTLICDCCYSGSEEQTTGSFKLKRGLEPQNLAPIDSELDEPIWRRSYAVRCLVYVEPGFIFNFGGMRGKSHAYLSAYSGGEAANEDVVLRASGGQEEPLVQGEFTRALLNLLQNVATDKVSYNEVVRRFQSANPSLAPQYIGHGGDRLLFSARELGRTVYQLSHDGDRFILGAGAVQGVSVDAQFAIYPSQYFSVDETPLAQMFTTNVQLFSAELVFSPSSAASALVINDPLSYFAVQTRIGRSEGLHLHVPLSEDLVPVMSALAKDRVLSDVVRPAILLGEETQADLSVRAHDGGGRVEYLIRNPLIRKHGLMQLLETTPAIAEDVHSVLAAASKFFWHLHRSPGQQRLGDESFEIEMHQLESSQSLNHGYENIWKRPEGPAGKNIIHQGVVNLEADGRTAYGVRVENHSTRPLYVSVFYFDCSNLSIIEYYCSARPISPGTELTIGNNNGSGRPFKFYLPPDQSLDLGLVKFFISTDYVDLSRIVQDSPFQTAHTFHTNLQVPARPVSIDSQSEGWSTVLIPVLQHPPARGQS